MTETATWTVTQGFSEMLGYPTLAKGLEYLTDHFQKQENLNNCPTLSWPQRRPCPLAQPIPLVFEPNGQIPTTGNGKHRL